MGTRTALQQLAQQASSDPVAVYLSRLSPGSRRALAGELERLARLAAGPDATARDLPWHRLRYQHTQALRARLAAEGVSPATKNKALCALRGVLREAFRLGLMDAEAFHRAIDLPGVRATRVPRGRALSAEELRLLFAACDRKTSLGRRDAALLALLYGTGLRRSEVVTLDVADWNVSTGSLRVRGKGDRERLVYPSAGAVAALSAWLEVRGAMPGPLFLPLHRGGALSHRRLGTQAVLLALRRLAARAGVASFSPHDLRRTFISDLLDAGADLVTVQRLAGHAQPTTTAAYDRRGEQGKRRASTLIRIPHPDA